VHDDQPLTSVEAFALALVEASSRLTAVPATATASERDPHAADPAARDVVTE